MNEPKGLVASDAQKLTKRGPQLQQFMQALGPSKTDVPLEQRLAAVSDTVTNAADCANDASLCSPKQLCEVTTTSIDGKLVWLKVATCIRPPR